MRKRLPKAREYVFTPDMCRAVMNKVLSEMGEVELANTEKVYACFKPDGSLYVKVNG
jgi:hypothetical protein